VLHNFLGLLFVVMCLSGPAKAHPHVFVDARTGFIFGTDGQLEAVRRQDFWHQMRFKLSESLAHRFDYIMQRACCDASVALRMSFV
jgi:ABC-type uncharacterized transport system substrate-binding protein